MKKLIILLLPLLLLGGISQAQEASTVLDNTAQTKRTSKFQGLWQQRKGHGLYLDYGYEFIKDKAIWGEDKWPLRFDLTYQYDIPWRAKRVNLFVESGIGYERLVSNSGWPIGNNLKDIYYAWQWVQQRLSWRFGGGVKVHCTDWLYLSFEGGFQVGYNQQQTNEINQDKKVTKHVEIDGTALFGGQSAMQIVGQIKRVSIHLGYRANHWIGPMTRSYPPTHGTKVEIVSLTDWFLTAGVGYHF